MPLLSKQHSIGWEDHLWRIQFFLQFFSSLIFSWPWEIFCILTKTHWQDCWNCNPCILRNLLRNTEFFFDEHSYMVKSSILNFSEVLLGTRQEVFSFLAKKVRVVKTVFSFCHNRRFLWKATVFKSFFGFWLCSFLVRRFIAFSRKKVRGVC